MKKLIFAIFAIGLIFIGLNANSQIKVYTGSTPYNNQSQNAGNRNVSSARNSYEKTYATKEQAVSAYMSGNFSYYIPSDNRNYGINPVDGVNTVAAPLPADAVIKMPTVEGIRWTLTEEGSISRFQVVNGRICSIPYALHHCGNAVIELEYLLKQAPVVIQNPPVIVQAPPTIVQNYAPPTQAPCLNCPGEKQLYNYSLSAHPQPTQYVDYNNYSQRMPQYPVYEQPVVAYERERKSMPGWAKVAVSAVVLGTASYFIFKKSPSEPTDQEVITLPPTAGMVGVGFSIGF